MVNLLDGVLLFDLGAVQVRSNLLRRPSRSLLLVQKDDSVSALSLSSPSVSPEEASDHGCCDASAAVSGDWSLPKSLIAIRCLSVMCRLLISRRTASSGTRRASMTLRPAALGTIGDHAHGQFAPPLQSSELVLEWSLALPHCSIGEVSPARREGVWCSSL